MNSEAPLDKDSANISAKPQLPDVEALLRENSHLKTHIQRLKADARLLEHELREMAGEKAEILSILSDYRRDKTITAYSNDSNPKNHLLVQEFIHLKNQDFQSASFELFDQGCSAGYFSKSTRRQDLSRIQAILSQEILINGIYLSSQEDIDPQQILDSLVSTFSFLKIVSHPDKLLDELKHLIEKGLKLVGLIASADPPGELWLEAAGTTFDGDRHEPVIGCEEAGEITWTVYPGYQVGHRIFAKAIVFTTQDVKRNAAMLTDTQTLEKLSQCWDYGDAILQVMELVEQNPPSQDSWVPPSLNETLQSLKASAQRTKELASSPIKIGLMGEFSAGKTLLLGSLVGYADALPVSEVPTTGNVTAIHLIQQSDFQTTKIGKFTVHYLNHSGVKDCLAFMLEEAEKRTKALNLPIEPLVSLRNDLKSTNQVDSHQILAWCAQFWNQVQSLELRSLMRELVTLVRTYQVYGNDICGRSYQVDQVTAKDGLTLADPQRDILALDFRQLPIAPKPWKTLAQPSAKDLQSSFSLIRRIDVNIEISKEVWDLSSFQGANEFVLLDFPGLGADDSGVRDAFLSLRELKDVQTILLLLDGRHPGAGTAAKIRSMLERDKGQDLRDRIIVGVGRFNQLPLGHNDERAIESLLEKTNTTENEKKANATENALFEPPSSSEPFDPLASLLEDQGLSEKDQGLSEENQGLSEEDVLAGIDILNRTIVSASNLTTEKENVVLLSQLHGLARLAEHSRLIKVGSPEFLPQLDKVDSPDDVQMQTQWRQLSQALPANSALKRQLNNFVEDGGIGRLRALLKAHVALHGLRQLLEDTQAAAQHLQQQQRELKKILDEIPSFIPVVESKDFLSLREAIVSISSTYNHFQKSLNEKPVLANRSGVALNDVVQGELLNQIYYDWTEWAMLFDRSQGGIVTVKERTDFSILDVFLEDEEEDEEEESIPIKSDDFYGPFKRTLEHAQSSAHEHVIEATKSLFRELNSQLEPTCLELRTMLRHRDEQYIKKEYGRRSVYLFKVLLLATEPLKQLSQKIIEGSGIDNDVPTIKIKDWFPLASEDETHKQGQIFDWHPHKHFPAQRPRPFHHQILVLRLRQAISSSAETYLNQYLSQLTKELKTYLNPRITAILDNLNELLKPKHEGLLNYLVSTKETSQMSQPVWLESLSQIAKISYPND